LRNFWKLNQCSANSTSVAGEITVGTTEPADARWFSVDDLPSLPPERSIARYISDMTLGLR